MTAAHLAGWLFADLLLVLFLVSLSAQARSDDDRKRPSPSPSPSQSASPSPSPTITTQAPRLLSKRYCELLVRADFGAMLGTDSARAAEERLVVSRVDEVLRGDRPGAVVGKYRTACLAHLRGGEQAGMVIAYGAADQSRIGQATLVAERVNLAVIEGDDRLGVRGHPRFQGAGDLAEWTGREGADKVKMIVFFYES